MDNLWIIAREASLLLTNTIIITGLVFTVILLLLRNWASPPSEPQPPSLPETIPFISNTILSLTDLPAFTSKVARTFRQTNSNVLTYHLGPKKVYLVQGPDNVAPLLRVTNDGGSEAFIVGILGPLEMDKKDIAKFKRDTSSRLKKKAPWSDTPEGERVWYGLHKVYEDYMTRTMLDGKPSDRAPRDDPTYAGTIATPPDREMKVRWKRLW
ncbi:hypothetical protein B0T16DRAFT_173808 [Cercophora newfieldiana]|uniref:Cytochrome P450 n=1 Tax=Cercophora newfieldiana TaxID=92897 RepID=A0AA40CLH4_9PEZI|nr:hypothetical protein B0T16DRAFT_173808 [Cercophora newfieldiana]